MPLVQTRGAASAQGFGEFAQAATAVNYIEDVFSTYLYTGTGAALTITNNIDTSTYGGLVWIKSRSAVYDHLLFDTARGTGNFLSSNLSSSASTNADTLTAFNTTGFSLGNDSGGWGSNISTVTTASWTFRKQPKFFDVVTYTGDGVGDRTISHNLGAVPAVIIIKQTNDTRDWIVRTTVIDGSQDFLFLNKTDAKGDSGISNTWSTTSFTVSSGNFDNGSGNTYVAYLFASNAGGFGLTGSDNVISCGTYTEGASAQDITLGYEPQWLLMKRSNGASDWYLYDTMRGMSYTESNALVPNTADSEAVFGTGFFRPTATGFTALSGYWGSGASVIYIAIRRGPMKVPTTGTSVFAPIAYTGTGSYNYTPTIGNFVVDMVRVSKRTGAETYNGTIGDRLKGARSTLFTPRTQAEATTLDWVVQWDKQNSIGFGTDAAVNEYGTSHILHAFSRAPSFFDEVCYTGTGVARTVSHNLAAVPELMIVKGRSSVNNWIVYSAPTGNTNGLVLNVTNAPITTINWWNNTSPTSSVFTVGAADATNLSGATQVAYLFATCAGVSKVGSYTGTGTTLQIDCGFTAGARFVLIKRTDSTGDWYVWDSARGIVAGNDPYLLLNSTAAEVTGTDYVDTYSAGFEISSTAPAAINANGGTYIFLAIA